jgi:hypothetical protein
MGPANPTFTPHRIVPDGYLFPSPDGKRLDPDNFGQNLRDVNESADGHSGSLDFRRTFGSQLAQRGESLYKIATIMDNSPEICRRHYALLIPEALSFSVELKTPAMMPPTGLAQERLSIEVPA